MSKGNNMVRCLTAGLVVCLMASSALAGVTAFTATPVPGAPAGFATTDIKVSFEGQYTGSQMLTPVLPAGSIYQDALGGNPPLAGIVAVFPGVAFDTFVAQGSPTSPGPNGDPSLGGGAVDLGGPAAPEFSTSRINQAWNPAGGVVILDKTDFLIARVTLSTQINGELGSILALASAAGTPSQIQGRVENGVVMFGSAVNAPVVDPLHLDNPPECLNCTLMGMAMLAPTSDPADSWGGALNFLDYTPGFGAPSGAPGLDPTRLPSWDPLSQKFSWDTTNSSRGTYRWEVSATNAGGTGTGVITVDQRAVPEPASIALAGLALFGLIGLARRKG
jgi:hypothetical protein